MSPKFEAPRISERAAHPLSNAIARNVGRSVLALGLLLAPPAVLTAARPAPAQATVEFVNDYPHLDAPCYPPSIVTDARGNYVRCNNYDWRVPTRNAQGTIIAWPEWTNRGFGARNCADGAAYWVKKYTGIAVPSSLGNANTWDNNAAGYTVKNGTAHTIEPGDIAQSDDGAFGHVGFVTKVIKDASGNVTGITTAELNKAGTGEYSLTAASSRNSAGKFGRGGSNDWDHFIDVNGPNRGLNNEDLANPAPAVDPLQLSFVRLNHGSGNIEVVSYSEASNYQTMSERSLAGYPAVPPDGNVVPLFQPDGDLSFVRLNHPSGKVEVATYSEASGYKTLVELALTGYPAVPGDGSVIPMYQPDGDLSFIRLNHASGKAEVISYTAASGYKTLSESRLAGYPATIPDGSVVPLYWLNGDLVFLRLNHGSGHAELISYSASSGYQQMVNYRLLPYPAVPPDGAVVPMFQPQDGDLSFIRLKPQFRQSRSYYLRCRFQLSANE